MTTVVGGIELGRELVRTLQEVNQQIEEISQEADRIGTTSTKMQDSNGNYILAPILAAKAQCLHSLVLVNQRG